MGQVIACCTVAEREANDDTIYRPPPQEIKQTWKEKIETNEGKVVSAVDPKFKCRFCNYSAPHNSDVAFTGSEDFCPYYLRRYIKPNNTHWHL